MIVCLSCGLGLMTEDINDGRCIYCNSDSITNTESLSDEPIIQNLISEQNVVSFKTKKQLWKISYHQSRYARFLAEGKDAQAREEYYRKLLLMYRVFIGGEDDAGDGE